MQTGTETETERAPTPSATSPQDDSWIVNNNSSPRINPFHLLSHPSSSSPLPPLPPHLQRLAADVDPPVHITKVTPAMVTVAAGPGPEPHPLHKIAHVFKTEIMQGPPPSPPISEAEVADDSVDATTTEPIITSILTAEPDNVQSPRRTGSIAAARTNCPQELPSIHRRRTNPTSTAPQRSPLLHTQSTLSPRSRTTVPGLDGSALDSDILAQAENIRRGRLERRQKKAEPAPAREETKVMVGNLIGEDHVNYILMYNMLTGIRIGVSHCSKGHH